MLVPWQTRFQQLKEFKTRHGHCRVPSVYEENLQLANWVGRMRRAYKRRQKGENCSLTKEKVKKLNDLGFEWTLRVREVAWETRIKHLEEFQKRHGNCRVPKSYEENKSLSRWVGTMRQEYRKYQKGKNSFLTTKQVKELTNLGFEWELRVPWQTRIQQLKEFKKRNGHCRVPLRFAEYQSLGPWVGMMRKEHKKYQKKENCSLTIEKVKKLNDLGFEWDLKDSNVRWQTRIEHLPRTMRRDCKRRQNGETTSFTMEKAVSECSDLTDDRHEQLENLGFQWGKNSASVTPVASKVSQPRKTKRTGCYSEQNEGLHPELQKLLDKNKMLVNARKNDQKIIEDLQHEKQKLMDEILSLVQINYNLRRSHTIAMSEERAHLERETKRRKVAEDHLEKAKQLLPLEMDDAMFR